MTKHLPTLIRVLLGLIFSAAAVAGMIGKIPPPKPEAAQVFMGVLFDSGLLYVVKILELLCGLALLTGFFVPLALLVLAPIIANIVLFHIALDPSGLMVGVILTTLWVINALSHRIIFAPLIQTNPKVK